MEYILDKAIEYYKSMEFKSCCENIPTHLIECGCHGLPIDPEYFILQDMIKAKEENKKLKDDLLSFMDLEDVEWIHSEIYDHFKDVYNRLNER